MNLAFPEAFLHEPYNQAVDMQRQRMSAAAEDYSARREAAGQPVTAEDTNRFELEWLKQNKVPHPPLQSLIDHIDQVAKVAGVDHVGLGSDSNGQNFLLDGTDSAADLPKITEAVLERGYSPEDIRKILGSNGLRVLRDVERIRRDLQQEGASHAFN